MKKIIYLTFLFLFLVKPTNLPKKNKKQPYKLHPNFTTKGKKFPKELYPNKSTRGKKFPKKLYPDYGMRNKTLSEAQKKKISKAKKGMKFSEEHKKNMSKSKLKKPTMYWLGKKMSKDAKRKMSIIRKKNPNRYWLGKHRSKETKKKIRDSVNKLWDNKEFREKNIKAILKGTMKRPTSYEKRIIDLIKKFNLPYKYVGDGSFLIGYKNPDFININGEKISIEVFHDYWKIKEFGSVNNYKKIRSKYFNEYGWEVIFIDGELLFKEDWEKQCINIIKNLK